MDIIQFWPLQFPLYLPPSSRPLYNAVQDAVRNMEAMRWYAPAFEAAGMRLLSVTHNAMHVEHHFGNLAHRRSLGRAWPVHVDEIRFVEQPGWDMDSDSLGEDSMSIGSSGDDDL